MDHLPTESSPSDLASSHELAQARLVVATDAAQLGLWDWDLTDDSLVWDARSVALYGQQDMPLTGSVWDINRTIHPDDQAAVAAELDRAISTRTALEVEFRVVHPDGTERVVYARGQALLDARGTAVRMIGTNTDVTELRAVQRQAVEDTARMAGLVEVARELGEASTEPEVLDVVHRAARALLRADAAALCVLAPGSTPGHGPVRALGHAPRATPGATPGAGYTELAGDVDLPAVETIRSGAAWFVERRSDVAGRFRAGMPLWEASGVDAVAVLPLTSGSDVVGSLSVTFTGPHAWRDADRQLMRAFAALTAQALRRVWARQAEVTATREAQRWAAQQTALVALASSLELARNDVEVLAVVAGGAVGLLRVSGTALCLREHGRLRTLTTRFSGARVQAEVTELPEGCPLPMVDTALTGRAHHLPDVAAAVALLAGDAEQVRGLHARAAAVASASVPLGADGVVGSLCVTHDREHAWTPSERQLLDAFAALTAQALERIRARDAEQAANTAVRRFSETLQRSLLTSPPEPDHLHVAVRYCPAGAEAQVGGDWYDAFMARDGATSFVVGDVTGHDRDAAAAMGQMRNVLRGIAHVTGGEPAAVLTALDEAVHDLAVGAMATVVLAKVVQTPPMRARGQRRLRWSNAGHPPPLLLQPDGSVELLETETDLLVGFDPAVPRHDHEVDLRAGATLLLYSDGLVERRGSSLQDGLDWLVGAVRARAHLGLDELCDGLLAEVGGAVEDDVALVAVRAHPEDHPRPAEAGPVRVPLEG